MKETAQIVQQQLKEIGVEVELEGLEGSEFLRIFLRRGLQERL